MSKIEAKVKIKNTKLSDIIAEQLETMIIDGTFVPGQKLPPERELSRQFEVSRPSLREAINKLEAKGLITRKQGGGTFVSSQLAGGFSDPLFTLLAENPESQYDLLEFRHALEGISAFYAALRGTESDISVIQNHFQQVEDAVAKHDIAVEAQAMQSFYEAIVEASHNVVLLHLVRGMASLLEGNILHNLQVLHQKPEVTEQLMSHRRDLLNAIVAGQPEKARIASNKNLAFIEDALLEINKENSRLERSQRRAQLGEL